MDTKWHDSACLLAAVSQFGLACALREPLLMFSGAGSLAGLLMTPDLDWDGEVVYNYETGSQYIITRERTGKEQFRRRVYSKASRRWPPGLQQWWQLYALLFRHRRISHFPIVGTLTRVLWIVPPFLLFALYPIGGLCFFAGLAFVDVLHWLMDDQLPKF